MDDLALAVQDAIDAVREIAPNLVHPEPLAVAPIPASSTLRVDSSTKHHTTNAADLAESTLPLQRSRRPRSVPSDGFRNSFQVVFRLLSGGGSIPRPASES